MPNGIKIGEYEEIGEEPTRWFPGEEPDSFFPGAQPTSFFPGAQPAAEEPSWLEKALAATVGKAIGAAAEAPVIGAPVRAGLGALEWLREKAEKPWSAIITALQSPALPALPEESWLERQLREYEAWQAPKYAKGAAELSFPLWWLPIGGGVGLGAKALSKVGLVGAAGVAAKAARGITAAERALAYPITKPAEIVIGALGKPVFRAVGRLVKIPKTRELMAAAFEYTKGRAFAQKIAKIPGVGKVIEAIKPATLAEDPIRQGAVIRGQMEDMAEASIVGATAKARSIRPAIKQVEETVVDPAVRQKIKLPDGTKSMAAHDIVEYLPRYEMPRAYEAFYREIRAVSKEMSAMLKAEKVPLRQLKGESDFGYLHRVVRSVKEEETRALADSVAAAITREVGVLPALAGESSWAYLTRVSEALAKGTLKPTTTLDELMTKVAELWDITVTRQRLDRSRLYATVAEGLKGGVKYAADPLFELQEQLRLSYRLIINKRVGELLRTSLETTTRAELVEARYGVSIPQLKARAAAAGKLKAVINRASRGEKIPPATLAAIERQFPEQGAKLRELVRPTAKPEIAPVEAVKPVEAVPRVEREPSIFGIKTDKPSMIAAIEELTNRGYIKKVPSEPKTLEEALKLLARETTMEEKRIITISLMPPAGITRLQARAISNLIEKLKKEVVETVIKPMQKANGKVLERFHELVPEIDRLRMAQVEGNLSEKGLARLGELESAIPKAAVPEAVVKPPVALPAAPAVSRATAIFELRLAAKDEALKAVSGLARARRLAEGIVAPEMGEVIGVPGISGRVITTQIIGGKKVLGSEIAKVVREQFGFMPAGAAERATRRVGMVAGVMRMAKASLDLSVQLIQTSPMLGLDFFNLLAYPGRVALKRLGLFKFAQKPTLIWARGVALNRAAFGDAFKAEARYWAKPENLKMLQEAAKRTGLVQPSEYFEAYGPVMQKLGKIPVIGRGVQTVFRQAWGRAEAIFAGVRNTTANEYRKAYWQMAEADGKLTEMVRASNLLTGVLSTRGMGVGAVQRNIESGILFFSPRFTRAVGALFGHMFAKPKSWTGKQAMQAITGLLMVNYTAFTAIALAMGQKPKIDPRPKSMGGDGADWLTVEVAGRRIGLGGPLSDVRLAVNIVCAAYDEPEDLLSFDMENPIFRRLRGKFAPPTAAFYDYMVGRNYIGQPTRGEGLRPTKETVFELGKWGLPIWVESMVEEGFSLPAVLMEFFGGRTFPESLWTLYNNRLLDLAQQDKLKTPEGKLVTDVDQISGYDKAALQRKYPELTDLVDVASAEMERRGYNPVQSEYWNRRTDFRTVRIAKLAAAQELHDAGKRTGVQLRRIIQDTGRELGAQYRMLETEPRYAEVLAEIEEGAKERAEEAAEKGWWTDIAYRRYYDILFDPAYIDPDGVPKYRERDAALDALRAEVGDDVWAKVQEWISGEREDYPFVVRQYYDAIDLLRAYWDIRDNMFARYPHLKALQDEIDRLEGINTLASNIRARALRQSPTLKSLNNAVKQLQDRWRATNPEASRLLEKFYPQYVPLAARAR